MKLEVACGAEALRAGLESRFLPVAHWGHLQSFKTPDARALPPECWFHWARALLGPQEFSKPPWVVHTRSPGREQRAPREDGDSAGNTGIPRGP